MNNNVWHFVVIFCCVLGVLTYLVATVAMILGSAYRWYYGLIGFLMLVLSFTIEFFLFR
jgi:hypothetical protein